MKDFNDSFDGYIPGFSQNCLTIPCSQKSQHLDDSKDSDFAIEAKETKEEEQVICTEDEKTFTFWNLRKLK